MRLVFATVGVPPTTGTAPPLTRMRPAASRLKVRPSSRLLPKTDKIPEPAEKTAFPVEVSALLAPACRSARSPLPSGPEFQKAGPVKREELLVALLPSCRRASPLIEQRPA